MTDIEIIKELLQAEREHNTLVIQNAVKETVNGNIRRLDEKIDRHIKAIEPFLLGMKGFKIMRSVAMWIAGTVITVGTAWIMVRGLFK